MILIVIGKVLGLVCRKIGFSKSTLGELLTVIQELVVVDVCRQCCVRAIKVILELLLIVDVGRIQSNTQSVHILKGAWGRRVIPYMLVTSRWRPSTLRIHDEGLFAPSKNIKKSIARLSCLAVSLTGTVAVQFKEAEQRVSNQIARDDWFDIYETLSR